jgi:hypothetical protein
LRQWRAILTIRCTLVVSLNRRRRILARRNVLLLPLARRRVLLLPLPLARRRILLLPLPLLRRRILLLPLPLPRIILIRLFNILTEMVARLCGLVELMAGRR